MPARTRSGRNGLLDLGEAPGGVLDRAQQRVPVELDPGVRAELGRGLDADDQRRGDLAAPEQPDEDKRAREPGGAPGKVFERALDDPPEPPRELILGLRAV